MHVVIADSGVARHSVVPDTHGTIISLHAALQISRDGDMLHIHYQCVSILNADVASYLGTSVGEARRTPRLFSSMIRRVKPRWLSKAFLTSRLGRKRQPHACIPEQRSNDQNHSVSWWEERSLRDALARLNDCSSPAPFEQTSYPASHSQLAWDHRVQLSGLRADAWSDLRDARTRLYDCHCW